MNLEKDLWYIERTDDPRFQKVVDYCKKHSGKIDGWTIKHRYYGRVDPTNMLKGYNGFNDLKYYSNWGDLKEITLDQFLKFTELFVLPERWCIKLDFQEAVDYANKYGKGISAGQYIIDTLMYAHFPIFFHGYCIDNRVHKGYELITKEQFFKHVMKQEFILPEKYFITKIDHPDYKLICDYFQEKSGLGYEDFGNYINLCYNSEWKIYKGHSAGLHNTEGFVEVSVEDFVKHVLNKEIMTQEISRGQLIHLHNCDNCGVWQSVILGYLNQFTILDTDDNVTYIEQKDLDRLLKEGTDNQKKLVTDLGIVLKEDKNAFVTEFPYDHITDISEELFGDDSVLYISGNSATSIDRPDLKGRSFMVSNNYTVKLHDSNGKTIIEINKK